MKAENLVYCLEVNLWGIWSLKRSPIRLHFAVDTNPSFYGWSYSCCLVPRTWSGLMDRGIFPQTLQLSSWYLPAIPKSWTFTKWFLKTEVNRVGLKIDTSKNRVLKLIGHRTLFIYINGQNIKDADQFVYLSSVVSVDVIRRITSANPPWLFCSKPENTDTSKLTSIWDRSL